MGTKNEYNKRVENGQDIFDLCLQEYGGINALFLLLADNPQLDLERQLIPGEVIKFRVEVPEEVNINKNLMDHYRAEEIRVNMKEKELLLDDVVITTTTGVTIQASPTGLTIAGSNTTSTPPNPVTTTGVLTSQGAVLVTSNGAIIRPEMPPVIGTSAGFSLVTSQGDLIGINLPKKTFLTTASGDNITTAQGDLLIL